VQSTSSENERVISLSVLLLACLQLSDNNNRYMAEMKNDGGGTSSPSPRRVVVAVDGSEESMHALSWCLSNVVSTARTAKAPPPAVVLVHARPSRALYYPAMDGAGEFLPVAETM
jgi:hypothetical protein